MFTMNFEVYAQEISQNFQYLPSSERKVASRTILRDLNRLEDTFFKTRYKEDTELERINRLEFRAYGAIQSGTEEERLNKLKKTALSYRSARVVDLENEYSPYYQQPIYQSGNGWHGFFGNMGNYFNGVPTGFTPPINSGYYNNSYHNDGYDLYNNQSSKAYRTNYGWGYKNNNATTHSGVTILD